MHAPTFGPLLALLFIFCGGCSSLVKPSLADRTRGYEAASASARADYRHLTSATFYLLAADREIDPAKFANPRANPDLLTHGRGGGLAFAIDARGYLLTASHCVGEHMYLIGVLNGQATVLRPAVIARETLGTGAEYALLRVDEPLREHFNLAGAIAAGDSVTAVLLDWTRRKPLEIAGGVVQTVRPLPNQPKAAVLETSVPLWQGDSGGPLLNSAGQAVGINTAGVVNLGVQGKSVHCLSFLFDAQAIRQSVEEDVNKRATKPSAPARSDGAAHP